MMVFTCRSCKEEVEQAYELVIFTRHGEDRTRMLELGTYLCPECFRTVVAVMDNAKPRREWETKKVDNG